MFTGYQITEESRELILKIFPPIYERVICHHITEIFGVLKETPVPLPPNNVKVIGHIDSGDGVEGLVVMVNNKLHRPDGKIYHLTLSLSPGRRPVETNDYMDLAIMTSPFTISVIPKLFN